MNHFVNRLQKCIQPGKKTVLTAILLLSPILIIYLYMNSLILDELFTDHCKSLVISEEQEQELMYIEANQLDDTAAQGVPVKGYHLHVNLDEKKMYVYKDGILLNTYLVSGGKSSTPSPLGTWKIISKSDWGEGFGGTWLGFNVPWGKYGIHGTVSPGLVGKSNASKGCIRMRNKDAKALAKIVPHGTTVTITSATRIVRTLKAGDIGSDVRDLQQALSRLGYYKGSADGRYGTYLKNSVIKFQKDNKLQATGIVNKNTFNIIINKATANENDNTGT